MSGSIVTGSSGGSNLNVQFVMINQYNNQKRRLAQNSNSDWCDIELLVKFKNH